MRCSSGDSRTRMGRRRADDRLVQLREAQLCSKILKPRQPQPHLYSAPLLISTTKLPLTIERGTSGLLVHPACQRRPALGTALAVTHVNSRLPRPTRNTSVATHDHLLNAILSTIAPFSTPPKSFHSHYLHRAQASRRSCPTPIQILYSTAARALYMKKCLPRSLPTTIFHRRSAQPSLSYCYRAMSSKTDGQAPQPNVKHHHATHLQYA